MTDPEQFEAFMKAYQNMVYTTALRLLGRPAEAEDIAQEVFLRAYDRFDEIRDQPTVGGWLRTVAKNMCLNHLSRYRSRWRLFSEIRAPEADQSTFQDEIDSGDSTDRSAAKHDEETLMESFLLQLPDKQRVPLVLYHYDGMSYEAIASSLGVSLGKVKTDIRRGRESLREKLVRSEAARLEWGLHSATSSPSSRVKC